MRVVACRRLAETNWEKNLQSNGQWKRADDQAHPQEEYSRRLDQRRQVVQRDTRMHRGIADARLGVFTVGLILAWVALWTGKISLWWVVLPAIGFFALIVAYDRVGRVLRKAERASSYYEAALDRLADRWAGRGESGSQFSDEEHLFALDLDLFGTGSVFERLCVARTSSGQRKLADWLRQPTDSVLEIQARQAALVELRDRLDLREDVALLGDDVRVGVAPESLIAWGQGTPIVRSTGLLRLVAAILAAVNVLAVIGWAFFEAGRLPALFAFLIAGGFAWTLRGRVRRIVETIDRKADDLKLLAALLLRVEQEPFSSPRLLAIRKAMESHGETPSHRIARLARMAQLLEAKRNQLFAPFGLLTLWSTQFALAVESWRIKSGGAIETWLEAIGEFEALCSLAAYTYENPADPFPELESPSESKCPIFEAEAIGHPLIALKDCVRNDLKLGGEEGPRVLLISGSNMSGKSTLLRSVGVNSVLALAGAPVRAKSLRLSPLAIGATLRVQDSLQAGKSRFYAEITRLRRLVDLADGPLPVLFLLDEILHGTNSHDRRLGAEAVVQGLIDRGAIGLVTTHDLALADIAERLAPRARNVHFEDHLEDGVMTFDYIMRSGVVRKSNALALMRAVGLEV